MRNILGALTMLLAASGCTPDRDGYLPQLAVELPMGCRAPTPDGQNRADIQIACTSDAQATAAREYLSSAPVCARLIDLHFATVTVLSFTGDVNVRMTPYDGVCSFE